MVVGSMVTRVQGDPASGIDPEVLAQWAAAVESNWGDGSFLALLAPSVADDARFTAWWRRYERSSVTPNAAGAYLRFMLEIDVSAVLSSFGVPTLVIHRRDSPLISSSPTQSVRSRNRSRVAATWRWPGRTEAPS